MTGHKHTRGILSRLGKANVKSKKKRLGPFQKALRWAVAVIGLALLGIVVAGSVSRLFMPELSVRQGEVVTKVISVKETTEDLGPGAKAVAVASVEIEGRATAIGVTEERREGVVPGATLRVKYTQSVASGAIRVDEWSVVAAP